MGEGGEHRRSQWLDISLLLSLAAAVAGFIKLWAFAQGNTETLQVMLLAGGLGSAFSTWLAVSIPVLTALAWLFLSTLLGEALRALHGSW